MLQGPVKKLKFQVKIFPNEEYHDVENTANEYKLCNVETSPSPTAESSRTQHIIAHIVQREIMKKTHFIGILC